MNVFVAAFIGNILPILLAGGAGFLLSRKTDLQPGPLSKIVIIYLFSPCLIFELITANANSDQQILGMLGFTILVIIAMTVFMGRVGIAFGWPRSIVAAAMLASLATNSGNYGMSLSQFAFGDKALPFTSPFMIGSSLMIYTLGVAIASWGSGKPGNPLTAPLKYPFLYAFVAALVCSRLHLSLPLPVDRVVHLFSQAAIPTQLVLLGVQLNQCAWRRPTLALALTNVMRLTTSPLVAIGLAALFALQGPARQAGILQAAMPTAVRATLLATEFNLEPTFITVSVALSTLLSVITLSPLIVYLST